MNSYKHTQFGWVVAATVGPIVVFLIVMSFVAPAPWVTVPLAVLFAALFVLFGSLTTEIHGGELIARFGPGPIAKRFALTEIEDARVVRNRWWYGWGIRLTPRGWMFNVSGLDAVELQLRGDKRFRIGTDRPEELVRAILDRR